MQYRPEIDGLRALAVIPVILFHAGFGMFGGGFVGVDVFFVVSGYLITTMIAHDMDRGRFSVASFYERRARRILPALFLMTIICAPLAWMYLTPRELREFSQSLIAVVTFSSNIFFWLESGYFSTTAELKPLLHTWTLAVEEQFYVFFPLFLMGVWKFGKRRIVQILAVGFAFSLGLAHWGAHYKPDAAFYLLPTRAWELIIGALAAFYLLYARKEVNGKVSEICSIAGLVMIGAAVFLYSKDTPFPGLYALLPTLGTLLVILFAEKGTLSNRLLSAKPMVGVGLVSYSAYLWHQPLFAFARHNAETASQHVMALLAALSFVLALATWKFVEQPFRKRTVGTDAFLKLCLVATFLVACLAAGGYYTNGFEKWMARKGLYELVLRDTDYDVPASMFADGECRLWVLNTDALPKDVVRKCHARFGKALVVLGDSHAMNVYNILAKTGKFPFVLGVSQGGCRPYDDVKSCHYRSFDQFMKSNHAMVATVVYHQSGSQFVEDSGNNVDSQRAFSGDFKSFSERRILGVLSYLKRLEDTNRDTAVVWLGPFIEYRSDPLAALSEYGRKLEVDPRSVEIFSKLENVIRKNVKDAAFARYVGFNEVFDVPLHAIQDGCFIFRDRGHFSRCGENLLGTRFLKNLDYLASPGAISTRQ